MNYKTFFYNLFLEPETALKFIKENFNINYILLTLLMVLTGWINNAVYLENYTKVNSMLIFVSLNFVDILIRYFIIAILIHSFLALFNHSGDIKIFFASLFLCQTPFILLSSIGLLRLLFGDFNYTFIKFILQIWSLYLLFICIKVNYSIGIIKTAVVYCFSIIFITSIVFISFILNIVFLIMKLF